MAAGRNFNQMCVMLRTRECSPGVAGATSGWVLTKPPVTVRHRGDARPAASAESNTGSCALKIVAGVGFASA